MKKNIFTIAFLITLLFTLFSFDIPTGWFAAGSKPKSYEMGIDKGNGKDGGNAATIKSVDKVIYGFGTLMQQCKPNKYLGKRIKMTGYIKSENVGGWAGLWLRVDQANSKEPLSFDNMVNRAIKGTSDWTKYEIVLDVPENASLIAYGALLDGTGQIWFDKITFEIVDNSVETTDSLKSKPSATQSEPTNLDFEK